ncbi:MAG TPA: hypothetical protein VNG33_20110 [Polyangiaceae bacterium]|nr:hypothetical protein [Polyangiaceae bacterium]
MSQTLELEAVDASAFGCAPSLEEGKLTVSFNGTGDVAAIELLSAYLKRVHSEAERLGVSEVTCDFRKLLFMNSSCFKAFVVWIDTVKNATRAYRIRFLTDPEMHWQRRSLEALRRLATNVVSVEGG